MAMAKLFWLRVLIVLSITACLVSDSMAMFSTHKGGYQRGKIREKVLVILRHVYPVVRKQKLEQTFQMAVAK